MSMCGGALQQMRKALVFLHLLPKSRSHTSGSMRCLQGKVWGQWDIIKMTHFANQEAMLMNCYIKGEQRKSKMGKEASLVPKGVSGALDCMLREKGAILEIATVFIRKKKSYLNLFKIIVLRFKKVKMAKQSDEFYLWENEYLLHLCRHQHCTYLALFCYKREETLVWE